MKDFAASLVGMQGKCSGGDRGARCRPWIPFRLAPQIWVHQSRQRRFKDIAGSGKISGGIGFREGAGRASSFFCPCPRIGHLQKNLIVEIPTTK